MGLRVYLVSELKLVNVGIVKARRKKRELIRYDPKSGDLAMIRLSVRGPNPCMWQDTGMNCG
jgi:hypothetical protein